MFLFFFPCTESFFIFSFRLSLLLAFWRTTSKHKAIKSPLALLIREYSSLHLACLIFSACVFYFLTLFGHHLFYRYHHMDTCPATRPGTKQKEDGALRPTTGHMLQSLSSLELWQLSISGLLHKLHSLTIRLYFFASGSKAYHKPDWAAWCQHNHPSISDTDFVSVW